MEEGEPIEHKLVTRAIATAQKRVETHNFEIRKHLLEYDDVMNKQREIVYGMRRQILDGESQEDTIAEWVDDVVGTTLDGYAPAEAHPEDWDLAGLGQALNQQFDVKVTPAQFMEIASREGLEDLVGSAVKERYAERERELGIDLIRMLERHEMLIVIDQQWKDHLLSIDHLKEGIGLRGYGQRDPLTEYKREAFDLFEAMVERVKGSVLERLYKVQVVREAAAGSSADDDANREAMARWLEAQHDRRLATDRLAFDLRPIERGGPGEAPPSAAGRPAAPAPRTATGDKVGRNDPCPCGSGKKYKKCHYLQQGGSPGG
jgi:preprotein translocase subunit SecA